MKPPPGYAFINKTWSLDEHQRCMHEHLNMGFGLITERSFLGRYYLWGKKYV